MVKIAVVILNWNGHDMLTKYLPTVYEFSHDTAVVYVADNASTDDSLELLRLHFPQVHVIRLDRNYGFAEGYNQALGQIEAEYYVLLNSDVEVTPNWLAPLSDFMDAHQEYAACQPKLLSLENPKSFEYAGAAGGYLDKYGYPFCRGRIFGHVEEDHGQYDTRADILWATGACLLIRARDYWAAGGFDGRFFAHNEEIDLCWRLRLTGRKICCIPDSRVYHLGGGTLPQGNPKKTFLNFRNNLTMLYKNLPDTELRMVMCMRWWLDHLAAWQALLLHGSLADFKAIRQARRAYKEWRPDFEADRERIQKKRVLETIPERKEYSLLWSYYIKGICLYSELP